MTWLLENWTAILELVGLFMVLASAVTRLTPTPTDDEWLDKLRRLLGRASLLEHNDNVVRAVKPPGREAGSAPPPHPDDAPLE